MAEAMKIDNLDPDFKELVLSKVPDAGFDLCLTCGTCTGGCAASELMDMDPRKLIRMLNLGMDDEVLKSDWKWVCSMCLRCVAACPMKINIPALTFNLRASVPREKRPKGILGSCDQHIRTGSAMGAQRTILNSPSWMWQKRSRKTNPGLKTCRFPWTGWAPTWCSTRTQESR